MGERKVLNKYFPPDFDPAALPKRKRAQTNDMKVRMMLPMSVRCKTCGTFMYKGTKFNTRKEDVLGETYLGIQVFRFYYRCTNCAAEFTMKTDPKNSDYTLEEGASRNYEHWREEEKEKVETAAEREAEEMGNAMKALENRTLESKREMDIMAALDEMRTLKSRHAKITTEDALAALQREADRQAGAPEGGEGTGPSLVHGGDDATDDLAEFYRLKRAAAKQLRGSSSDEDDGGPAGARRGAGTSGVGGSGLGRSAPAGVRVVGRTAGVGLSLAAAAMEEELEGDRNGGLDGDGALQGRNLGGQEGNGHMGDSTAGMGTRGANSSGQDVSESRSSGPEDPLATALDGVKGPGVGAGREAEGAKVGKAASVVRPQVRVVARARKVGAEEKVEPVGLGIDYQAEDSGEGEGGALGGLLGGYGSGSGDE